MASDAVQILLKYVKATLSSKFLIQCVRRQPVDWNTREGDMLKRAYWTCYVIEG